MYTITNNCCKHALLQLDGAGASRGRPTVPVHACYVMCMYM